MDERLEGSRVGTNSLPRIIRRIFVRSKSNTNYASTQLIISRHGERVDSIFGPYWLSMAFDDWSGRSAPQYNRFHLNMPVSIPTRASINDFVSRLLAMNGLNIVECYSSPSLRSIQTANLMLEGMNKRIIVPIKIEPALFECYAWYNGQTVKFMSMPELLMAGFNIDRYYSPVVNFVNPSETEIDYYARSRMFAKRIDRKRGTCVLVVGHAATPEVVSRALLRHPPRPSALLQIAGKVDFGDMSLMEKNYGNGKWKFRRGLQ
ncbi:hypothetical protein ACOME3_003051 [Neoechinorhynchus agilis]